MLNENLKNFRRAKGLSQEELALQCNVVRQTVSKWEKGLSVPDAELLMRIAEVLETTVDVLLGETVSEWEERETEILAAKLEILNEQFAKEAERKQKTRRMLLWGLCIFSLLLCLRALLPLIYQLALQIWIRGNGTVGIIGGADGPTAILAASAFVHPNLVLPILLLVFSCVALYRSKTK